MSQATDSPMIDLRRDLDYQTGGIVSRILLKQPTGSVTAFAFDAGQELSEHTCPYEALLDVVEGVHDREHRQMRTADVHRQALVDHQWTPVAEEDHRREVPRTADHARTRRTQQRVAHVRADCAALRGEDRNQWRRQMRFDFVRHASAIYLPGIGERRRPFLQKREGVRAWNSPAANRS